MLWIAACKPTEVDEKVFPALPQTCYEMPLPDAVRASWADQTARPSRCVSTDTAGAGASSAEAPGSGSSGAPGAAGGGQAMTPMEPPALSATDAGTDAGPDAGGSMPPVIDECPEERIRALFSAELTVGGCQDSEFGGCHGNELTAKEPRLLSSDLRAELVGHVSNSEKCGGQTWITRGGGLEGSLLWNKVTAADDAPGNEPRCGDAMPLREAGGVPVPPAELDCLRQWILELASGQ